MSLKIFFCICGRCFILTDYTFTKITIIFLPLWLLLHWQKSQKITFFTAISENVINYKYVAFPVAASTEKPPHQAAAVGSSNVTNCNNEVHWSTWEKKKKINTIKNFTLTTSYPFSFSLHNNKKYQSQLRIDQMPTWTWHTPHWLLSYKPICKYCKAHECRIGTNTETYWTLSFETAYHNVYIFKTRCNLHSINAISKLCLFEGTVFLRATAVLWLDARQQALVQKNHTLMPLGCGSSEAQLTVMATGCE